MMDIDLIEIAGSCLLFCLVFGMSATVDIGCMMAQTKNIKAIFTGIVLQFAILPALGWCVVKALAMPAPMGLTLLVVTSSPGGSYSNWWCSMFNADLALSVTMTAISTLLSSFMLPLNLYLYSKWSYGSDILGVLDWTGLFVALAVVLLAIGLGLYCSEVIHSHSFNAHANRVGNFAGIALVIFSAVMSNSDEDSKLWQREWIFYVGVAAPCLLGLIIANILTTGMELLKPERVTVSIECCYQNVGIAASVALSMFEGQDLAEAMGVPFYYGLVEAVILGFYCIVAWKIGWTKAPRNISIFKAIATSYEVVTAEKAEDNAHSIAATDEEGGPLVKPTTTTEHPEDEFHYVRQDVTTTTMTTDGGGVVSSDNDNDDVPPPPPPPPPPPLPPIPASSSSPNKLHADLRRSARLNRPTKEPSFMEAPGVIPPTPRSPRKKTIVSSSSSAKSMSRKSTTTTRTPAITDNKQEPLLSKRSRGDSSVSDS